MNLSCHIIKISLEGEPYPNRRVDGAYQGAPPDLCRRRRPPVAHQGVLVIVIGHALTSPRQGRWRSGPKVGSRLTTCSYHLLGIQEGPA